MVFPRIKTRPRRAPPAYAPSTDRPPVCGAAGYARYPGMAYLSVLKWWASDEGVVR